jgi:hypothetical protein
MSIDNITKRIKSSFNRIRYIDINNEGIKEIKNILRKLENDIVCISKQGGSLLEKNSHTCVYLNAGFEKNGSDSENRYQKLQVQLPTDIKIDIIKYIKMKDMNINNKNEITGEFSIITEKELLVPKNLFYLKSSIFQNSLMFNKQLKFIDIPVNDYKQLKIVSKIRSLIGCRVKFINAIDDKCLHLLNKLRNLNYLYVTGKCNSKKRLCLNKLIDLELFNNHLNFLEYIKIRNFKVANVEIPNEYINGIKKLDELKVIEFKDCILPSNILDIFSSKIKTIKIINCKSKLYFRLNYNFFIKHVYIENFFFTVILEGKPNQISLINDFLKKLSEKQGNNKVISIGNENFKKLLNFYLKNIYSIQCK